MPFLIQPSLFTQVWDQNYLFHSIQMSSVLFMYHYPSIRFAAICLSLKVCQVFLSPQKYRCQWKSLHRKRHFELWEQMGVFISDFLFFLFFIKRTNPQHCGFTQLSKSEWHHITWMITNNSPAGSQQKSRWCNYSPPLVNCFVIQQDNDMLFWYQTNVLGSLCNGPVNQNCFHKNPTWSLDMQITQLCNRDL